MRIDESSRNELRKSHATIQELTSQVQKLQERVNCMNDSREFQDLESICSGKLSHVPSRPAVVPSPRSMSSRYQSLRPDTWSVWDKGKRFWQSTSSSRFITDTLTRTNPSATGAIPVQVSTGTPVARGEEQTGSTIPMPMFAVRLSTMNSFLPAEIPQNFMSAQQRLHTSKLQFDEFPTPSTFSCWKTRLKTHVSSCSDFPSDALFWGRFSG